MDSFAEARDRYERAMSNHQLFRQQAVEYRSRVRTCMAEISRAKRAVEDAEQLPTASETEQAERKFMLDDALWEYREAQMVFEDLCLEMSDLVSEFRELKTPENDVVQLGRDLRSLRE